MTLEEKREFVRSFMESMSSGMVNACENMPEHWDGHEIRAFIAEKFAYQVSELMKGSSKRGRECRNDAVTRARL